MFHVIRILFCLLLLLPSGCDRGRPSVAQGYVEGEYIYMASPYGGRLDDLCVRRGQRVEAGQPLFRLEATEELEAARNAAHVLAGEEARFADMQRGKRPEEMDVLRAQLAQAKTAEILAARTRKRDDAQFGAGGIAQAQMEQSRAAHDSAAARVRELTAQVAAGDLPARADQLREQAARVNAARADAARARWRFEQKTLDAPGQSLVADTLYRRGEWVASGAPVVKLLPPEQVKIRFFVPETALGGIKIGQTVAVHVDGRGDSLTCTVSYLSDAAEYTPPVIYSNETRSKLVFLVEALPLREQAADLHPGQPVQVTLP